MSKCLQEAIDGNYGNYIFPFVWQHGEPQDILLEELEKVKESNLKAFCVEARPHPHFLQEHWWSDMDFILNYARQNRMDVWLLDDDRFPTGHGNGVFQKGISDLANRFLTNWCTDVIGPLRDSCMLIRSVIPEDGVIVGIAAYKRVSAETTQINLDSAVDLSVNIRNGWLRWNVPNGLWRIFIFYTTHQGEGRLDYFNIIDSESVKLFIDTVYEPHYEHYKNDFGKTFKGFFSDEPEFGNLAGYDFQARLGRNMKFIPWCEELYHRLSSYWGDKFITNLAVLWCEAGDSTNHLRYEYMNETTLQLKKAFSDQIADWCNNHHVEHIGHIIEDDNSHARLGCSTGHYYRSISGMAMAGIDVVLLQIMPGMNHTVHQWVASDRDGEFFHYGLAKMGSSLAHIDSGKKGNSMCEIFGAYGWQEGMSLMKWLADHMMSRGINHFVPHAFSPSKYPEPDCPPHFYARGHHPQYPYFGMLMEYMNRSIHFIVDGIYPCEAAVLYHAESEWAGDAMLFQKPVRLLLENQIECDIIPADMLETENEYGMVLDHGIKVANQCYKVLVIPYCEYITVRIAGFIEAARMKGVSVCFISSRPTKICESVYEETSYLNKLQEVPVIELNGLISFIKERITPIIQMEEIHENLRIYPYIKEDSLILYCFNEDMNKTIKDNIHIQCNYSRLYRYDAFHNRLYTIVPIESEHSLCGNLLLEAGEASILICTEQEFNVERFYRDYEYTNSHLSTQAGKGTGIMHVVPLCGTWNIYYKWVLQEEYHLLRSCDEDMQGPEDMTDWVIENRFCGNLKYSFTYTSRENQTGKIKLHSGIDVAEILVNGSSAGVQMGAPYLFDVTFPKGENKIDIVIPTTPVWESGDDRSSLTVLPPFGMQEYPAFYHS